MRADAVVTAYEARCGAMKDILFSDQDFHKLNASNIFAVAYAKITDKQRQMGKRIGHACNYMMGPQTFAETSGFPEATCGMYIRMYHATYPEVPMWHKEIERRVRRTRMLENPMGRRRMFLGNFRNQKTFRDAVSFIPQSTVADVVNEGYMRLAYRGFKILTQVHDALLIQVPFAEVADALPLIKQAMEIPLIIKGERFVIPVDVKIGLSWDSQKPEDGSKPVYLMRSRS